METTEFEKMYADMWKGLEEQTEKDNAKKLIDDELNMFHFLNERGTFTGSRAYGIASENSDYDYALNKTDYDNLYKGLCYNTNFKIKSGDYMVSRYYTINDKVFNVFCVDYVRLETFKMTTEIITLLASNPDYKDYITNKEFRVMFFRNVESMLKLSMYMESENDNSLHNKDIPICP